MCPVYKAWRDIPIHGVAHRPAECANGGKCDRKTGKCNCFDRFEGPACQLCKLGCCWLVAKALCSFPSNQLI